MLTQGRLITRTVAGVALLMMSSQSHPETPRVDSQQQAKQAPAADQHAQPTQDTVQSLPPAPFKALSDSNERKAHYEAKHGEEEGTEFWPALMGYRLKVTDTLLVAFTFALSVATFWLYRATRDLVIGADKASERELRAYVSMKEITAHRVKDANDRVLVWRFSLPWENSGGTPTRNLVFSTNWCIRNDPLPDNFDYPYPPGRNKALIGPKAIVCSAPFEIPHGDMNLVLGEKAHIYIWGQAQYDDVFEKTPRHVTRFCFEVMFLTTPGAPGSYLNCRHYGEYNCADEDCTADRPSYRT